MIVTRLLGGLGNQMFQYAFGYYLAKNASEDLVLDVSGFESYTLHELAIDQFDITASRLPATEMARVPNRYRGKPRWTESLANIVGTILPRDKRPLQLRREKPFGFSPTYLSEASDVYLDGYWQSERFFPGVLNELKREFALKKPLSDASCHTLDQIKSGVSVSIHVRRGDYVTNSESSKIYRCLDADYYRNCLTDLRERFCDLKVFLFSNDIPWCLSELDVGVPLNPVTHNDATTAYEDMYLMSQCDHAIIANSSFSWWGAYLGGNEPNRRVYYPDPWFHPGTLNGDSMGCERWVSEREIKTKHSRVAA
ncbi:alpha-1,2-fucosyltransferase [Aporhodopirellula aestuarii]|uniref:Alpha-1,2-fucosyltransferase n=1 Tax=Aporhodopirellula aestuarii TaxID=2950107 RepID=A0ABT0U6P0_9BACT|nr:alpha-1,2-fucosyltransferase [Aporhodopirellula aestuarii]MCM2372205.1 alpha-1,2-fucosyltransferase [Aporhodopirellula aestuarii]